ERIRDQAGIRWRGVLERSGTTVEFPVDPPDPAEPNRPLTALMNSLASLRVRNFLADAAPGADTLKWTAFPAWRIQARLHDGRMSQPLTIYAEDSDGNFSFGKPYRDGDANPVGFVAADYGPAFTVGDAPAVMEMFPESVYSLCVPPYRYRSVKVIDQDPRNWTRVELHSDDKKMVYLREVGSPNDQWWREEDGAVEPLTDDNNLFVGLLLKLSQLRSIGFVGDDDSDAGEFGLDHPEISAIVYVSSEAADDADGEQELFTLSIGDEARYGANARYARLDQGGAVFLLSESLAEGLRRKYR
ncbi:MAG: DUF4340 domain-containing protein, partial [Planctomycetes bacterium]|nr:DUF4340 domain-containing protein [Planctomycetota bacterium]